MNINVDTDLTELKANHNPPCYDLLVSCKLEHGSVKTSKPEIYSHVNITLTISGNPRNTIESY